MLGLFETAYILDTNHNKLYGFAARLVIYQLIANYPNIVGF